MQDGGLLTGEVEAETYFGARQPARGIERGGKLHLVPGKEATADLTRGYCASQSRTSSATVRACSTQEPMEGPRR